MRKLFLMMSTLLAIAYLGKIQSCADGITANTKDPYITGLAGNIHELSIMAFVMVVIILLALFDWKFTPTKKSK